MRHSIFVLAILLSALTGCQEISSVVAGLGATSPAVPSAPPANPPAPAKAPAVDRVVVLKGRRLLELVHGGQILRTFPIALGPHARGPKRESGDGRTPEGVYNIDGRSERTRYTRELHISYPNAEDRARARERNVEPGGDIFIHGLPQDFGPYDPPRWERDWTDGCISVGNAAIVAIWDAVPDGTRIEILP